MNFSFANEIHKKDRGIYNRILSGTVIGNGFCHNLFSKLLLVTMDKLVSTLHRALRHKLVKIASIHSDALSFESGMSYWIKWTRYVKHSRDLDS